MHLKADEMRRIAAKELKKMGIDLPNVDMEIANLFGGQRLV